MNLTFFHEPSVVSQLLRHERRRFMRCFYDSIWLGAPLLSHMRAVHFCFCPSFCLRLFLEAVLGFGDTIDLLILLWGAAEWIASIAACRHF